MFSKINEVAKSNIVNQVSDNDEFEVIDNKEFVEVVVTEARRQLFILITRVRGCSNI